MSTTRPRVKRVLPPLSADSLFSVTSIFPVVSVHFTWNRKGPHLVHFRLSDPSIWRVSFWVLHVPLQGRSFLSLPSSRSNIPHSVTFTFDKTVLKHHDPSAFSLVEFVREVTSVFFSENSLSVYKRCQRLSAQRFTFFSQAWCWMFFGFSDCPRCYWISLNSAVCNRREIPKLIRDINSSGQPGSDCARHSWRLSTQAM